MTENDKVQCPNCKGRGVTTERIITRVCSICDGRGTVTPSPESMAARARSIQIIARDVSFQKWMDTVYPGWRQWHARDQRRAVDDWSRAVLDGQTRALGE